MTWISLMIRCILIVRMLGDMHIPYRHPLTQAFTTKTGGEPQEKRRQIFHRSSNLSLGVVKHLSCWVPTNHHSEWPCQLRNMSRNASLPERIGTDNCPQDCDTIGWVDPFDDVQIKSSRSLVECTFQLLSSKSNWTDSTRPKITTLAIPFSNRLDLRLYWDLIPARIPRLGMAGRPTGRCHRVWRIQLSREENPSGAFVVKISLVILVIKNVGQKCGPKIWVKLLGQKAGQTHRYRMISCKCWKDLNGMSHRSRVHETVRFIQGLFLCRFQSPQTTRHMENA